MTRNAGRAGFGNLEMAIKDADGVIIPSHVAQLETGTAKFLVTFTPATKGPHTVNITFNKEVLKSRAIFLDSLEICKFLMRINFQSHFQIRPSK